MAQMLRACDILTEDPALVPSTYVAAQVPPSVAPVLGDSMSSSDCHGHQAHMVHTHAEKNTYIHKNKYLLTKYIKKMKVRYKYMCKHAFSCYKFNDIDITISNGCKTI